MLSTELLTYYRHLSQQPLTIVDVETTGHIASQNRVMELSVLQATLADGILNHQTSLINPQTTIPEAIIKITGITPLMVADQPIASQVLPAFLPLLESGTLTAHNIEFDYAFLRAEYQRLGITYSRLPQQQFCTLKLARLMLANLSSRSLPKLVKRFKFDVGPSHRAEADTMACWLLAKRLLQEIQTEDDETLLQRFAQEWVPLREAAKLLNCSQDEGRSHLEAAGVRSRFMPLGSSKTLVYRRGELERVVYERRGGQQLSLL